MRKLLVGILVSLLAITGLPTTIQAMEAAPANPNAEGTAGGVTLSWDYRNGISVNVYRAAPGDDNTGYYATAHPENFTVNGNRASWTDTDTTNGQSYRYRLVAFRNGINDSFSPQSNEFSATAGAPSTGTVAPPTNVTAQRYSACLLYTSPSPRDRQKTRMPSSA